MINDDLITAFNIRVDVNPNNIKTLKTETIDRVKAQGAQAEALLKNRDLAQFVHFARFDISEQLGNLKGHTEEDDRKRIALANQLAGLDKLVDTLKEAVYRKSQVVKLQQAPTDKI